MVWTPSPQKPNKTILRREECWRVESGRNQASLYLVILCTLLDPEGQGIKGPFNVFVQLPCPAQHSKLCDPSDSKAVEQNSLIKITSHHRREVQIKRQVIWETKGKIFEDVSIKNPFFSNRKIRIILHRTLSHCLENSPKNSLSAGTEIPGDSNHHIK